MQYYLGNSGRTDRSLILTSSYSHHFEYTFKLAFSMDGETVRTTTIVSTSLISMCNAILTYMYTNFLLAIRSGDSSHLLGFLSTLLARIFGSLGIAWLIVLLAAFSGHRRWVVQGWWAS